MRYVPITHAYTSAGKDSVGGKQAPLAWAYLSWTGRAPRTGMHPIPELPHL